LGISLLPNGRLEKTGLDNNLCLGRIDSEKISSLNSAIRVSLGTGLIRRTDCSGILPLARRMRRVFSDGHCETRVWLRDVKFRK
jgi:hypothetical protein